MSGYTSEITLTHLHFHTPALIHHRIPMRSATHAQSAVVCYCSIIFIHSVEHDTCIDSGWSVASSHHMFCFTRSSPKYLLVPTICYLTASHKRANLLFHVSTGCIDWYIMIMIPWIEYEKRSFLVTMFFISTKLAPFCHHVCTHHLSARRQNL